MLKALNLVFQRGPGGDASCDRADAEGGLVAIGVCPQTIRSKWVGRFVEEGGYRTSRPQLPTAQVSPADMHRGHPSDRSFAMPTPDGRLDWGRRRRIASNRQPGTMRLGLNRLSALEAVEPPRRYERETPGEMIPIDIKNAENLTGSALHYR